jgi:hypothetical protein
MVDVAQFHDPQPESVALALDLILLRTCAWMISVILLRDTVTMLAEFHLRIYFAWYGSQS